jgi:hypothetical protein
MNGDDGRGADGRLRGKDRPGLLDQVRDGSCGLAEVAPTGGAGEVVSEVNWVSRSSLMRRADESPSTGQEMDDAASAASTRPVPLVSASRHRPLVEKDQRSS